MIDDVYRWCISMRATIHPAAISMYTSVNSVTVNCVYAYVCVRVCKPYFFRAKKILSKSGKFLAPFSDEKMLAILYYSITVLYHTSLSYSVFLFAAIFL